MKCVCSIYQDGYGLKEWEQEFDVLPRKGDIIMHKEGGYHQVDYCVHQEGKPVRIEVKDKD